MSQYSLLKFMRRKAKKCPDDIVAEKDGKKLTLLEVSEQSPSEIFKILRCKSRGARVNMNSDKSIAHDQCFEKPIRVKIHVILQCGELYQL